jgi:hypothetical protein
MMQVPDAHLVSRRHTDTLTMICAIMSTHDNHVVMDYNTILVHADTSPAASDRIRLATGPAQAAGAHLIGTALTGISRFVTPGMVACGEARLMHPSGTGMVVMATPATANCYWAASRRPCCAR